MRNLYIILGVKNTDDKSVIKKAFKRLAQKNHPDKGGDIELFKEIQKAYDILSKPESRKRYDETGRVDSDYINVSSRAKSDLSKLFIQIIASRERGNVIDIALLNVKRNIESNKLTLLKFKAELEHYTKSLTRVNCTSDENIFEYTINAKIVDVNKGISGVSDLLEQLDLMISMLKDYNDNNPDETAKFHMGTVTTTGYVPF